MRLLDTDTLSALVRPTVPARVVRNMQALARAYTSAVNVAEILFGIEKRNSERLRRSYDNLVFPRVTVLPFDQAAARHYGCLRAELERAGTPIGETDMMVGAVALANHMTVVTGNAEHFSRIPGLEVENWLD